MIEPLNLILVLAGVALLPFLAIASSSYIKISIVLMLVRNAIGAQQTPPNMALNALALILSIFIMAPVIVATYDIAKGINFQFTTVENFEATFSAVQAPLLDFLKKHTGARELQYFKEVAMLIWPASMQNIANNDGLLMVLPAFTLTELRTAFEIGFLVYLPFVAIDLVVSNILLAMGMMMVSPLTISLPFKLLLFVMVDGWSKLILSLVKTYV
jgi:type III secretion protein R